MSHKSWRPEPGKSINQSRFPLSEDLRGRRQEIGTYLRVGLRRGCGGGLGLDADGDDSGGASGGEIVGRDAQSAFNTVRREYVRKVLGNHGWLGEWVDDWLAPRRFNVEVDGHTLGTR